MTTSLLFPELQEQTHNTGCKRFFRIRPEAHVSAEWAGPNDCYRHKLLHLWNPDKPLILFAMMNPSGAGIEANDATVDKCDRMADLLGAGGIYVGNSCGYRARDCDELLKVADPVGPGNDKAIREMGEAADLIVIAHGNLPDKRLQAHADRMVEILAGTGKQLYVLGLSAKGVPTHPMALGKAYVHVTTIPVPWSKWPGQPSSLLEQIASRTPSR